MSAASSHISCITCKEKSAVWRCAYECDATFCLSCAMVHPHDLVKIETAPSKASRIAHDICSDCDAPILHRYSICRTGCPRNNKLCMPCDARVHQKGHDHFVVYCLPRLQKAAAEKFGQSDEKKSHADETTIVSPPMAPVALPTKSKPILVENEENDEGKSPRAMSIARFLAVKEMVRQHLLTLPPAS